MHVCQDLWFEVAVVRSLTVKDVPGKLSAIFKHLIEVAFFNPAGHDMFLAGLSLPLPNGDVRIHLKPELIIADEAALKHIFECMGSAGLRPCLLCANVFGHIAGRAPLHTVDPTGVAVYDSCVDASQLVLHDTRSYKSIMDRLRYQWTRMRKGEFDELQTNLGWNFVPDGLMQSTRCRELLDPASSVVFDPMHCLFVSGAWNLEMGSLITALTTNGISWICWIHI